MPSARFFDRGIFPRRRRALEKLQVDFQPQPEGHRALHLSSQEFAAFRSYPLDDQAFPLAPCVEEGTPDRSHLGGDHLEANIRKTRVTSRVSKRYAERVHFLVTGRAVTQSRNATKCRKRGLAARYKSTHCSDSVRFLHSRGEIF